MQSCMGALSEIKAGDLKKTLLGDLKRQNEGLPSLLVRYMNRCTISDMTCPLNPLRNRIYDFFYKEQIKCDELTSSMVRMDNYAKLIAC